MWPVSSIRIKILYNVYIFMSMNVEWIAPLNNSQFCICVSRWHWQLIYMVVVRDWPIKAGLISWLIYMEGYQTLIVCRLSYWNYMCNQVKMKIFGFSAILICRFKNQLEDFKTWLLRQCHVGISVSRNMSLIPLVLCQTERRNFIPQLLFN